MVGLEFLPFGMLIGALARLLSGRKGRAAMAAWVIAGAMGALLGGLSGRAWALFRDETPRGFAMSLLGAMLLVVAYHAVSVPRVRA